MPFAQIAVNVHRAARPEVFHWNENKALRKIRCGLAQTPVTFTREAPMYKTLIPCAVAVLAFATLAASSPARAYDHHVWIVNDTDMTIEHFFASNVGRRFWEEDILGDYVIPPGGKVLVNIDDRSGYCRFDFKTDFADGASMFDYNINVCEVSQYTVYEG